MIYYPFHFYLDKEKKKKPHGKYSILHIILYVILFVVTHMSLKKQHKSAPLNTSDYKLKCQLKLPNSSNLPWCHTRTARMDSLTLNLVSSRKNISSKWSGEHGILLGLKSHKDCNLKKTVL